MPKRRRPVVLTTLAWLAIGTPSAAQQLYTDPVLPVEGRPFRVVYRDLREAPGPVTLRITTREGRVLAKRTVPLEGPAGSREAATELAVPRNTLLRVEALHGAARTQALVPVVSPKREVNLIYFGMPQEAFDAGYVRWVTLVTSCPKEQAAVLTRRGIRALRWSWGSNLLHEEEKARGRAVTPEQARQIGQRLASAEADAVRRDGFDGLGMDEFGGYYATDFAASTKALVRGIIDVRKGLPKGFTLLAWHAGPIDPELMGLYKDAVEFLLPEAYLLNISSGQLGTELMHKDLEGRLWAARANDMFAAPYGSRCRVIPSVDAVDKVPVGEYEAFFRMLRRDFPEARGIGFFNSLSKAHWRAYQVLDRLCFDYFVRPVVTFQPDSLYHDRLGSGRITAWVSNIGAIDSGPVRLRLLVDGREVRRATVPRVPAGFSRVDNRAAALFAWRPRAPGTYRLRVEVVDPGDATVLDPAAEVSVYLRP